jgi:glycosyltransferase involved in cell wall biosynthesis
VALMAPAPILFVHTGQAWIRGSEQCLLDLVTYLDRRRFSPVVVCDSPVLAEAARSAGAPVHEVRGWQFAATHWLPSREEVSTMRRIVDQHGIRLIHSNDTEPIKAILPVARRKRLPVLAHLHITIDETERIWSFVHQVAFAVGVSQAAVAGLQADGFPETRMAVVYNGVDPQRLERGDASGLRQALGIPASAVVVAVVGSLIARKGVDVVLRAFEEVTSRRSDCHLLVCGDGSEREHLTALARRMIEAGTVHFLGERRDVGAILRDAADVFVSASREEAFPLTLLEAGYSGVPIVASAIPPHREFLGDDGSAGVLAPPDDAQAFARAIALFVSDGSARRACGEEARQRVRNRFLVSHVVQQFDELYVRLLDTRSAEFGWLRGTTVPRSYLHWARRRLIGRSPSELVVQKG